MADFAPFTIIVKNRNSKTEYEQHTQTQWYDWSIQIESDPRPALEKNVDHVIYHLHPSFPENEIRVDKNYPNFKLVSRGWAEFTISIDVHLSNGKNKLIEHYLSLSEPTSISTHFIDPKQLPE